MIYNRPIRELLVDAVAAMPPTFRRNEAVDWFQELYPLVKPSSVTAHITAATVNSRSRHHYPGAEQHLIFKRNDGLLERYDAPRHGMWDHYGELIPNTVVQQPAKRLPDHSNEPDEAQRTSPQNPQPPAPATTSAPGLLREDEVKAAVRDFLMADGYEVEVAWGHERGVDIEARLMVNGTIDERILIEAKGEASLQPQQVNYFLNALGELVQRLEDPEALYGLALPDNRQYRGLLHRLPMLASERLSLHVYFVRRSDEGFVVSHNHAFAPFYIGEHLISPKSREMEVRGEPNSPPSSDRSQ